MAKKKISSKAVVGGLVVLGLIGSAVPDDTPEELPDDPPAVQEEVALPDDVEEDPQEPAEGDPQESVEEPIAEPAETPSPPPSEPLPVAIDTAKQELNEQVHDEKVPDESVTPTAPAENQDPPAVDPEQAFREKLAQYKYVGSSESDKYHYPSCRWTSTINDGNLVHFDTEEEATVAGYLPCGSCKP